MADIEGYNMPDDLIYHEDDTWIKVEGDKVRIGMTDFFQQAAGDIVYVDLPFEGDEVQQGEPFGKAQSSKWIGKLVAPLSGTIEEVNYELDSDSTIINKDPYGEGWILVIEAENLDSELGNLMQGEALVEFIDAELKRAEEERAGA